MTLRFPPKIKLWPIVLCAPNSLSLLLLSLFSCVTWIVNHLISTHTFYLREQQAGISRRLEREKQQAARVFVFCVPVGASTPTRLQHASHLCAMCKPRPTRTFYLCPTIADYLPAESKASCWKISSVCPGRADRDHGSPGCGYGGAERSEHYGRSC